MTDKITAILFFTCLLIFIFMFGYSTIIQAKIDNHCRSMNYQEAIVYSFKDFFDTPIYYCYSEYYDIKSPLFHKGRPIDEP
jgi:hypothetical protein